MKIAQSQFVLLLSLLTATSGCLNPWTTEFPRCMPRGFEHERRRAQIQDPFPDTRMGPDIGFRPLEFQQQRSEPQIAKDRSYSGFLRQQQPPTPPAIGPGAHAPGYYYPGIVQ